MSDQMIGSSLQYPPARPVVYRRHARILGSGAGIPEIRVSNQDIIDQHQLIASDRAVQFSIGIQERRHVQSGSPPSKYLHMAVQECLKNAQVAPEQVDRILYARLVGDHAIPTTALKVLERMGVRQGIPVMDLSVACSGFLHATEMALNMINCGDRYVLVLGGDRAAIHAGAQVVKDTRTIFLNGDGFAAVLYGYDEKQHFFARYFYTDSSIGDFAYIPFGTELLKNHGTPQEDSFNLAMPNGPHIHQSIIDSCQIIAERLLTSSGMSWSDIDFLITSDQTSMAWKAQLETLKIPEEKSCSCFYKYGNTVAAMVPLNLHEAISTGKLQRGMTVMMMGHGAGASGGGFIFRY